MKKILIAGGIILLCSTITKAQNELASVNKQERELKQEKREIKKEDKDTKRNNKIVSYQSKQQFLVDFPDAKNTNWIVSKNFEEAKFISGGITMTAYYDIDSKLVGTTTTKSYSDIPAKAQEYIKKHYAGYTADNAILFDDNENNETDMVLYDTVFDDADHYFVPLKNDKETIILKIDMEGEVSFFKKL